MSEIEKLESVIRTLESLAPSLYSSINGKRLVELQDIAIAIGIVNEKIDSLCGSRECSAECTDCASFIPRDTPYLTRAGKSVKLCGKCLENQVRHMPYDMAIQTTIPPINDITGDITRARHSELRQ